MFKKYSWIKNNTFIMLFLAFILSCQVSMAQIGILSSNTSAKLYSTKHIGNYSDLLQEVIYTFSNTNIKFNVISETDLDKLTPESFNVVILPLVGDISQEAYVKIENYIKDGGKIVIIFPDIPPNKPMQKLADLVGVQLDQPDSTLFKSYINWANDKKISENDFPSSTRIARIKNSMDSKTIAVWDQIGGTSPAISLSGKGSYIGWRWGNDGNLSFNVYTIKTVLELLAPGIIKKEKAKLDFKQFNEKISQIDRLTQDTKEFLDSFGIHDSTSSLADIQEYLYLSGVQKNLAKSYYQNCDYEKAQIELKNAKLNAMYAYAKSVPSNIVE